MTVLSHQTIRAMCESVPRPLVTHYEAEQVRSASYDLRLGHEYFLSSRGEKLRRVHVETMDDRAGKAIEIPANQLVVVRTLENVQMPNNLVGHLTLKLDLLLHGLIMASQSQIDAGYDGPIFALLYNLSSQPVTLALRDPILRLEFATLDVDTQEPYHGRLTSRSTLADGLLRRLTSSLSAMAQRVAGIRRVAWGVAVGLVVSLIGLVIGLLGPLQSEASDAQASAVMARDEVIQMRSELRDAVAETARLRGEIRALRSSLARSADELSGRVPTVGP